MVDRYGLHKCKVKAVALSLLKEQPSELDKVYGRPKTKETDETVYYVQEFKVTCADKEYSDVLKFLRTDEYKIRNIFLKDIDVTMDYAGSFDKDEVIQHLTTKKGFRVQGSAKDANRTILNNIDQVGNNCLTYMGTVDGLTTRCKICANAGEQKCSRNRWATLEGLGLSKRYTIGERARFGQRSWFDLGRSHVLLQGYSSK